MELTKNLTQAKLFKSLVVIVLGSIALTISAKIKIPFYPVPMTMQTFVVLFLGISLGHKIALATIYFTGPTMGYLIGFLTACYLASKIKIDDNFFVVLFKLIIATSTIYILGLIWLGTLIGWDKPIFALGAKPFLLAEIFKIMLLALLTKQIIKIKKFI